MFSFISTSINTVCKCQDEEINTYKTNTENWGQKFIKFLLVNNISPLRGIYNITLAIYLSQNITI